MLNLDVDGILRSVSEEASGFVTFSNPDLKGEWHEQVFEGVRNKKGERASMSRELTREEKKRRVVLKRVNNDSYGMRSNFLRTGTMAQVGVFMCLLDTNPISNMSVALASACLGRAASSWNASNSECCLLFPSLERACFF